MVADNEKQSYTAMATVVLDGSRLPLRGTENGKAPGSLVKLGGMAPHVAHFGDRGWQRSGTLKLYLRWVRDQPRYADGRRIVLLLDAYSVHRWDAARQIADSLSITLALVGQDAQTHAALRSVRVRGVPGDLPPPVPRGGGRSLQQGPVGEHDNAGLAGSAERVVGKAWSHSPQCRLGGEMEEAALGAGGELCVRRSLPRPFGIAWIPVSLASWA